MQHVRIFQPPTTLVHEEIRLLYQHGFDIPEELLRKILALPRESAISDLDIILRHAEDIFRLDPDFVFDYKYHSFSFHAVMLLGRFDDDAALNALLRHFSSDEEMLDYWYNDWYFEDFWIPLYHLGKNRLEMLKKFVIDPSISGEFQRTLGAQAVAQIGLHQPEQKGAVIAWLREVFEQLNLRKHENIGGDSFLASNLTNDIADLDARELLPLLEPLFSSPLIDEDIACSWDEYVKTFDDYRDRALSDTYPNPMDWYKAAYIIQARNEAEVELQPSSKQPTSSNLNKQLVDIIANRVSNAGHSSPKVGRNEPCPCGSGKKYKRCCGAQ